MSLAIDFPSGSYLTKSQTGLKRRSSFSAVKNWRTCNNLDVKALKMCFNLVKMIHN